MSVLVRCSFLLAILFLADAVVHRRASAVLVPRDNLQKNQNISGILTFTETNNNALHIFGQITGLPAGKYGFHVHESGNILTCDSSGAHFNPEVTTHGGRNHDIRHVGDLGNIEFNDAGEAFVQMTDHMLSLVGRNSILGRTIVLHAEEDDLGLGGNEGSLTTGNAGARVACGVIGIIAPTEPWNSGVTSSPSLLLFVAAAFAAYFRQ